MMAINKELLGPQSESENEAFAIEALVFSVQIALQKAMKKQGITNKDLAQKLGMSAARISQVFSSSGPNLTLKTIARIQHALGEEFEMISKAKNNNHKQEKERKEFTVFQIHGSLSVWTEIPANEGKPRVRAMAA